MYTIQTQTGMSAEQILPRKVTPQVDSAANTSTTMLFTVPTDHFIHGILIQIGYDTTGTVEDPMSASATLADDATTISLILNGNNYVKDGYGDMFKTVSIMNKNQQATGFYMLLCTDPKIPQAKPIPAWLFSSITLKVVTTAAGSSNYNHVSVYVLQTQRGDITQPWQLLVEKYLRTLACGASTGSFEYVHERAYTVFGYVYRMDDNGTLSNTKFDWITLKAQGQQGEYRPYDMAPITLLRAENQREYMVAMPTGYFAVEFPNGLPTYKYTSLSSFLDIPSAGTAINLRVLERYVL
jgi:hypothetical protein